MGGGRLGGLFVGGWRRLLLSRLGGKGPRGGYVLGLDCWLEFGFRWPGWFCRSLRCIMRISGDRMVHDSSSRRLKLLRSVEKTVFLDAGKDGYTRQVGQER